MSYGLKFVEIWIEIKNAILYNTVQLELTIIAMINMVWSGVLEVPRSNLVLKSVNKIYAFLMWRLFQIWISSWEILLSST